MSKDKEEKIGINFDKLDKILKNMTDNERQEMIEHFRDKTPKGWLSIEDHLPQCTVEDFCDKGYSEYKIRYKDGAEGLSRVTDHTMWYYAVKDNGVTHWFND